MKPPKLDLHGVSHGDAPEIIHKFVNDNWGTLELHIVTGYSVAMKKIAMGVLNMYDVEVESGDPRNSGYLRVVM